MHNRGKTCSLIRPTFQDVYFLCGQMYQLHTHLQTYSGQIMSGHIQVQKDHLSCFPPHCLNYADKGSGLLETSSSSSCLLPYVVIDQLLCLDYFLAPHLDLNRSESKEINNKLCHFKRRGSSHKRLELRGERSQGYAERSCQEIRQ